MTTNATENESDRATQETIQDIQRAGSLLDAMSASWYRYFGNHAETDAVETEVAR